MISVYLLLDFVMPYASLLNHVAAITTSLTISHIVSQKSVRYVAAI